MEEKEDTVGERKSLHSQCTSELVRNPVPEGNQSVREGPEREERRRLVCVSPKRRPTRKTLEGKSVGEGVPSETSSLSSWEYWVRGSGRTQDWSEASSRGT